MIWFAKQTLILATLMLGEGNDSLSAAQKKQIESLLEQFDQAWTQNQVDGLIKLFDPQSACGVKMRNEGEGFLKTHRIESSKTAALNIQKIDNTLGIYAQTSILYENRPESEAFGFRKKHFLDYFYLTVPTERGLRILRVEEFDRDFVPYLESRRISCPACNFELTRPASWFLIPRSHGWVASTESVSFLHPSGRLVADFDVSESTGPVNLEKVFDCDQKNMSESCKLSPESCCANAKKSELGKNHQSFEAEGNFVRNCAGVTRKFHYLRRYINQGPILYSFHFYGEAEAFESARSEIDALRASLKIIDPERSLESVRESMKSRHNPGGVLEQNNYSNRQFSVRLQGPAGWKAEELSGPTLFHVRFSDPKRTKAKLSFYAIGNPNGWENESCLQSMTSMREEKLQAETGMAPKRLQSLSWPHKGLQSLCYELQWSWSGKDALRESVAYFPAGPILYILEFTAEEKDFESLRSVYQTALDSLSRF